MMKTPNVYNLIEDRIYKTVNAQITKNCEDGAWMECFSTCETSKGGDDYDFATVRNGVCEFTLGLTTGAADEQITKYIIDKPRYWLKS